MNFARREGCSYLLCQKYSDTLLLDRRDGTLVDTFSFGSEVVKIGAYTDTDDFMAFTRDGVWHYLDTEYRMDMVGNVFADCTSSNVKDFAMGDGYCVTLPYGSNRITVYRRALGEGMETFHEGEGIYSQAGLSGDGTYLAAVRYDEESNACVELFDTAKKELLWTYKDTAYYEAMAFGDFDKDGSELLLVVTKDACKIIDPADGSVRRTVTFEKDWMSYLGIDCKNGILSMEKNNILYGYQLSDGKRLYAEAIADGVTAVCNGRPFYALAVRETDELLFYQMGKEGVYVDPGRQNLDIEYLETMFFNEEDDELYLVYRDGTVHIFAVDWETKDDVRFCGSLGRYTGFPGKMKRYEAAEGADLAFLCGYDDAYRIGIGERQYSKYAHIRGFLACDAQSGTLYLHNGDEIYTTPLYSMEETVDMGRKVLQDSSYWNYTECWPGCLSND